jgi:hypothetical protein
MYAMKMRERSEGLLFRVRFLLTCEGTHSYTPHSKKGLTGRFP